MILIICTVDDIHVKAVTAKLPSHSFFVLYTELLLSRYLIEIEYAGGTIFDKITHKRLAIDQVTKIWHRRTGAPVLSSKKADKLFSELRIREAMAFLSYLNVRLKDSDWLTGHPTSESLAQSKLDQFHTAAAIGFNVPKTVFSNDKAFIRKVFKDKTLLAVKSMAPNLIPAHDLSTKNLFLYTALLTKDDLFQLPTSRFRKTINYIQEYIEKAFELRITVVGRELFACRLSTSHLPTDKGRIDFRQGYDYGLKHDEYQLSPDLAQTCFKFLQAYGLQFGCFDLLVSKEGTIYFLECNPNGQWLWIEQELPGLKISEAIARYLLAS